MSSSAPEVSVPHEAEIMEITTKDDVPAEVEQGLATVVEQNEGALAEWVTSNNFLQNGQDLIVIHRPQLSNGSGNIIASSFRTTPASGVSEGEESNQVVLFQTTPAKRKTNEENPKMKRWYRQKFCDTWLVDDRFKDWISKVPGDIYKVFCRFCKVELRAGCSELLKHMKTKYHMDAKNNDSSPPKELCYIVEQQVEELQPVHIDSQPAVESYTIQDQRLQRVQEAQPGPDTEPCVNSIQIMKIVPNFKTPAFSEGVLKEIRLSDFLGHYVLLTFYVNDFEDSSVNLLQNLISLQSEFAKYSCILLAASADSVMTHKAWVSSISENNARIPIPLLGDFNKSLARTFSVYDDESGCAVPSTFLIDPKGRLRHMTVNDISIAISLAQLETSIYILKGLQSKPRTEAILN